MSTRIEDIFSSDASLSNPPQISLKKELSYAKQLSCSRELIDFIIKILNRLENLYLLKNIRSYRLFSSSAKKVDLYPTHGGNHNKLTYLDLSAMDLSFEILFSRVYFAIQLSEKDKKFGWTFSTLLAQSAPSIGFSAEIYSNFAYLAIHLDLNEAEFILLRRAFVVYSILLNHYSLVEVVESLNLLFNAPFFNQYFTFNVKTLRLPLGNLANYNSACKAIFSSAMESYRSIRQECAKILEAEDMPQWICELITSMIQSSIGISGVHHAPTDVHIFFQQVKQELVTIFKLIAETEEALLTRVLKFELTDGASITTLQNLVDLYLNSRFSTLPLKLLGKTDILRDGVHQDSKKGRAKTAGELISNFGFSASRKGIFYNEEKRGDDGYALMRLGVTNYRGCILSSKDWTPLLNIIWIIATCAAEQDVYLIRESNNMLLPEFTEAELYDIERKKPSILCDEIYTLNLCGYSASYNEYYGIGFKPSNRGFNIADLFHKFAQLCEMEATDLVSYINEFVVRGRQETTIPSPQ